MGCWADEWEAAPKIRTRINGCPLSFELFPRDGCRWWAYRRRTACTFPNSSRSAVIWSRAVDDILVVVPKQSFFWRHILLRDRSISHSHQIQQSQSSSRSNRNIWSLKLRENIRFCFHVYMWFSYRRFTWPVWCHLLILLTIVRGYQVDNIISTFRLRFRIERRIYRGELKCTELVFGRGWYGKRRFFL